MPYAWVQVASGVLAEVDYDRISHNGVVQEVRETGFAEGSWTGRLRLNREAIIGAQGGPDAEDFEEQEGEG